MNKSLYSQLNQDLWVLDMLKHKKGGVFVDIGAHDGIQLSNTYLLESNYDWTGICIEANPDTFEKLKKNRSNKCVCSLLSKYKGENKVLHKIGELSFVNNINQSCDVDELQKLYDIDITDVTIETDTLNNILTNQEIPNVIDYLSIDIEGMELDVLKSLDFNKYHINLLTIEHNACHIGHNYRNDIQEFLQSKGFEFVKGNENVNNWDNDKYYIEDFYKNIHIV